MADDRGTGRTTKQLVEAPRGAIFIWCNNCLDYVRPLAASLGRTDLVIYGPDMLNMNAGRLRGRALPAIVVDHACRLNANQRRGLNMLLGRAGRAA